MQSSIAKQIGCLIHRVANVDYLDVFLYNLRLVTLLFIGRFAVILKLTQIVLFKYNLHFAA